MKGSKLTDAQRADRARKYVEAHRRASLRLKQVYAKEFEQYLTEEREKIGFPVVHTPEVKAERRTQRILKLKHELLLLEGVEA